MPTISVIVPVYNVEKYLNRCIDSILNQTFPDFELILIDDGSTDSSGKICDEYAKSDNRIIVKHIPNGGVSNARNVALKLVSSTYIAFCDSDDSWKANLLETSLSAIIAHSADLVVFNCETIFADGKRIPSKLEFSNYTFASDSQLIDFLIKDFFGYKIGNEVWTKIFKASIIKNHYITFPTTCNNFAEDMAFVLTYILFSEKVTSIPDCLYNYCIRTNSMMSLSKNIVKFDELNEVSKHFYKYFKSRISKKLVTKTFPILHFLIMYNQYCKIINTDEYKNINIEINKIVDQKWYAKQLNKLSFRKRLLRNYFGKTNQQKISLFSHYCHHKSWKLFSIETAFFYKFMIQEK